MAQNLIDNIDFFMIHKHGFNFVGRGNLKQPILRPYKRQNASGFLLSPRIYLFSHIYKMFSPGGLFEQKYLFCHSI